MTDFIQYSVDDTEDSVQARVYETIQGVFPDWTPREGHLEVVMTEEFGATISEVLTLQNDVPPAIFRWFGKNIMKFAPNDAQYATVQTTWTVTPDPAGRIIPANTVAYFEGPGEEAITFEVTEDVDVAPNVGTTAVGEVTLRAQEPGEAGNGFTEDPRLLDFLEFVTGVTIVGATSGGSDEETDEAYQARLSDRMTLLADRPVIADDVETFARVLIPAVMRAVAFDNYIPNGTDEQQTLTHNHTGGTFKLTVHNPISGIQTGNLNWNATAAQIRDAIVATGDYAEGDIEVSGGPLPALVTLTWRGKWRRTNVIQLTVQSSLTGGTTVTVATTVAGTADNAAAERAVTVVSQDELGNASSGAVKTLLLALLNASREPNFEFYAEDQSEWTIDVSVTVKAWDNADTAAVQAAVVASIQNFLNKALWGQPPLGESRLWANETVVRISDLQRVVLNTDDVRRIDVAIQAARRGDTMASSDVQLYGLAPVPVPGVITVTVNP